MTYVKRYTKKDGTKIRSHNRRLPQTRSVPVSKEYATRPTRVKRANREIQDLTMNKYFRFVPMDELNDILNKHGFKLPEEGYILTGRDGRATWQLTDMASGKLINRYLLVTWHKMNSGRYEIVSYI